MKWLMFGFDAEVVEAGMIDQLVLRRLRGRGRPVFVGNPAQAAKRDEQLASKHSGKILSKKQLLALFGYSAFTNVSDMSIFRHGLAVGCTNRKGFYKIVPPSKSVRASVPKSVIHPKAVC